MEAKIKQLITLRKVTIVYLTLILLLSVVLAFLSLTGKLTTPSKIGDILSVIVPAGCIYYLLKELENREDSKITQEHSLLQNDLVKANRLSLGVFAMMNTVDFAIALWSTKELNLSYLHPLCVSLFIGTMIVGIYLFSVTLKLTKLKASL